MAPNRFLGSASTIISAIVPMGPMNLEPRLVPTVSSIAEMWDQLRNWCLLHESMTAFVIAVMAVTSTRSELTVPMPVEGES